MRKYLVEVKFARERIVLFLHMLDKESAIEWVSTNMPNAKSAKAHLLTDREIYITNNVNQAHGVGSED